MITSVHFGGFHFFRKMASQTGTSAFIMSSETDRANKRSGTKRGNAGGCCLKALSRVLHSLV